MLPKPREVPSQPPPTAEDFRALASIGRPVCFRAALSNWPAIGRWDLEYLRQTAGSRPVPVEFYPEGNYRKRWLTFETTLAQYIGLISKPAISPRYYLAEVGIASHLPELTPDVWLPPFLEPSIQKYSGLFLGNDSITGLHYHANDQALLCQIMGRKDVVLFPPSDFRNLNFDPWYSHRFNFSEVNLQAYNSDEFPKLLNTNPMACSLLPGDALFIPMHWGHTVVGEGCCASMTFFWHSRLSEWSIGPVAAHALLGHHFRARVIRPLAKFFESTFRCHVEVS